MYSGMLGTIRFDKLAFLWYDVLSLQADCKPNGARSKGNGFASSFFQGPGQDSPGVRGISECSLVLPGMANGLLPTAGGAVGQYQGQYQVTRCP